MKRRAGAGVEDGKKEKNWKREGGKEGINGQMSSIDIDIDIGIGIGIGIV